jgi:MinD-like ATPase involved in chromosome partitioning or flagellar assembly
MATHYSGLQVLFNLQPASKSKTLAHTEVETLLQEIRQAATYVFVDVSGKPAQVWQTSLRECTKAVLVTDSGADGLEHAKAMSTNLRSKAGKKIAGGLIVVDRDGTLAEIDMARMRPVVEAAVEMPLLEVIPHDLKVPLEFEARGLPVVLAEPGRPISKAFHQLAEKLIANGSIPQSSEGSDE